MLLLMLVLRIWQNVAWLICNKLVSQISDINSMSIVKILRQEKSDISYAEYNRFFAVYNSYRPVNCW